MTGPVEPAGAAAPWCVLVEANGPGAREATVWRMVRTEVVGDRARAEARALDLAAQFTPLHPRKLEGRQVFRLADGTLVVHLQGAMSHWHMRVSVAELIGQFDGTGNRVG